MIKIPNPEKQHPNLENASLDPDTPESVEFGVTSDYDEDSRRLLVFTTDVNGNLVQIKNASNRM